MLYFDHSATTPIHPDVQSLINELNHDIYGNPSSIHTAGRKAKHVVETARKQIAAAINCTSKEIIFTGSIFVQIKLTLQNDRTESNYSSRSTQNELRSGKKAGWE